MLPSTFTTMDFKKSVAPYLNTFYYLGLSPCLLKYNKTLRNKILSSSFLIIHAIISLALSFSCLYLINLVCTQEWSRTDRLIINILALCEIIRIVSIFIQCIVYKNVLIDVIGTFRSLERFYAIHLSHSISYKKFKKQFRNKVIIVVVAYLPQFIMFIEKSTIHKTTSVGPQAKCLQIFKLIYMLYNIFYIDLLNFYFAELNVMMRRDIANDAIKSNNNCSTVTIMKQSSNGLCAREKLRHYKTVHFNLWETAQRISEYFGWSMIVMIIYVFVEFVYAAYFIILNLHSRHVILKVARKHHDCFVKLGA